MSYLTVNETAERLRRSTRFVSDELRRNNLRGLKVGTSWLIDETDLDVYLASKANVRPVRKAS